MSESVMQSMLRTSTSITSLAKALAVAVGQFQPIAKDREVAVRSEKGNYKFSYATLAEIVEGTRPALSSNGLVVIQMPTADGAKTILITRLMHESGEWMEGTLLIPSNTNIQQFGSALTYLRRYAYSSILGIVASDDDDDGNAAASQPYEARDRQRQQQQQNRDQQQNAPKTEPGAGDYVGADEKIYPTESADAWVSAWVKRINALMQAGNLSELQAAFNRNAKAIEATARHAPDHAKEVRDAIAKALTTKPAATNDNGAGAAQGGNDNQQAAATAKPWVINHTDPAKAPDVFDGAASWVGAWRIRINTVKNGKAPARDRRAKLAAMRDVNEAAFAAIMAAGNERAVKEATDAITRLDGVLAELEADEMTSGRAGE